MTAALDQPRGRRLAANFDTSRSLYPAIDDGPDKWAEVLSARPDVMWQMIADIVKVAKSSQSTGRSGRRPAIAGMSIDELWNTLYPVRFSLDPYPEALAVLISSSSQREYAARVPCSQPTLSRLLTGRQTPDLAMLAALARAGGAPAAYFVEYRAGRLAEIVSEVLVANPQLSAQMFKQFAKAHR